MKLKSWELAFSAMVGALYAVMTLFGGVFGLSYGWIQLRFSEALCMLPFFVPSTAWGLFIGCIAANLIGGCHVLDIVFGSLATLTACLCVSKIKTKWLAPLPVICINAVVVGAIMALVYYPSEFLMYFAVCGISVGIGEAVVCYTLGILLLITWSKLKISEKLMR